MIIRILETVSGKQSSWYLGGSGGLGGGGPPAGRAHQLLELVLEAGVAGGGGGGGGGVATHAHRVAPRNRVHALVEGPPEQDHMLRQCKGQHKKEMLSESKESEIRKFKANSKKYFAIQASQLLCDRKK